MGVQAIIAVFVALAVLVQFIPRRWLALLAASMFAPKAKDEVVAATQGAATEGESKWITAIRFLVRQFKAVAATICAVAIVLASLYALLTETDEPQWATHGIASSMAFLFGEAVGVASRKT